MVVLVLSLVIGTSVAILADWDEGDPYKMHYPQWPDVTQSPTAINSFYTYSGLPEDFTNAADDFECTETGLITDIHVWGCWAFDEPNKQAVFEIAIWSNVPAVFGGTPSMPGQILWGPYEFLPEEDYTVDLDNPWWVLDGDGYFGHPADPDSLPFREIYQYNFWIDPTYAFTQEAGTIYWVSVRDKSFYILNEEDYWGWNYCVPGEPPNGYQFMDNAVWWDYDDTGWAELFYPGDGLSADLAFVITGEPPTTSEPSPAPAPTQPSGTVGGDIFSVNKTALIAPWVAMAVIFIAGGFVLYRRRAHGMK